MKAGVSERLAALSPAQRQELMRALTGRGVRPAAPEIHRRPVRDLAPLSYGQLRLWFLEQLSPGSAAYHVPMACYLTGRLDTESLAQSLDRLVARHEILRTRFVAVDGTPQQEILPPCPVHMRFTDVRGFNPREEDVARAHMRQSIAQPFDLSEGYLLRCDLVRLDEHRHVLLMVCPHIVVDGWSVGILFTELTACYGALTAGREPELPDLPLQYGDFAAWERSDEPRVREQLEYWKQQMTPLPPTLRLCPAGAAEARGSDQSRTFTLGGPVHRRVRDLCTRESLTPFVVLLAAYQIVLWLNSGEDDIIVGIPISRRSHPGIQQLIGLFSNTLPLRVRLTRTGTLQQVLHLVQRAVLDAFSHQDVPLERVVQALPVKRRESDCPLFQTIFTIEKSTSPRAAVCDLTITPFYLETGRAQFDLVMHVMESPEDLRGILEFRTDIVESATIDTMVLQYERVVRNLAENGGMTLDALAASLVRATGESRPAAAGPQLSEVKRRSVLIF